MHQTQNILYQIKKESLTRTSPLFLPNHQEDDIRGQLAQLRTQLRSKDTEIIRLHAQIDSLKQKITLFEYNSKISTQNEQENLHNQTSAFSEIPMIFENKELKESNEILHKENLELNGKNNQLEAQLRESRSETKRMQSKLKQLEILEKMREERFKDEVQRLTPIIVEDNKDFTFLKQGILKLATFLRENLINIVFQIFLKCANQCEKEKKTSSFSIFRNYWLDLKSHRSLGFLSVAKVYEAVKKLSKMLEEQYGQLREEQYRDTMNEWIVNTIIDIKHSPAKEQEQKLFRYLGLLYRSKFPIKNEQFELDEDVKEYFEDLICQEIAQQIYKQ